MLARSGHEMIWRDKLVEYGRIPGLLQQLSNTAEAMCAPFWWSIQQDSAKPAEILHNGTICYLHSGVSELGVTANHVLGEYLRDLEQFGTPVIECQFGGSTIEPEKRVIAQNKALDIATLSVPEVFVTASAHNRKHQHTPVSWPPRRAIPGELVLYGGHPGILREGKVRTADLPFQWIGGSVGDVSPQVIVLEPGFETLTWLNPEPGATFNRDFRGMSGGPVFRVVEDVVVRLELVGFIYLFMYEADDQGRPVGDGHTLLARHAEAVRADGTLVVG
jgi:hypothetical protein